MKQIYKCMKCKTFTMKEKCPNCNLKTILQRPMKYSPEDKYGDYRRKALKEKHNDKGYI